MKLIIRPKDDLYYLLYYTRREQLLKIPGQKPILLRDYNELGMGDTGLWDPIANEVSEVCSPEIGFWDCYL